MRPGPPNEDAPKTPTDRPAPGGRDSGVPPLAPALRAAGNDDDEIAAQLQHAELRQRLFGDSTPRPRFGRYVVVREIGSGGMGRVYLAKDPSLDREVAIKTLKTGRPDADLTMRLLREAQALAILSHPNVVNVFDVGVWDEGLFFAMQFVPGPTLREWAAGSSRRVDAVLDVMLAAGRGLVAIHEAGLLHRDFKPENVIVSSDGCPRVLDFGLTAFGSTQGDSARGPAAPSEIWKTVTETGDRMGTPAYMAPEQQRGERLDARADQYAFCVVLQELLGGGRGGIDEPHDGVTRLRIPPRIRAVIARGLEPERDARWPSMRQLLDAISPNRSIRRWALIAGGGIAVLWVALWLSPTASPPACGAFAHDTPQVDGTGWAAAELNRYVVELGDAVDTTCAAQIPGKTTSPVLDCLRDRHATLIDVRQRWSAAPGDPTPAVADAVASLTPVDVCQDVSAATLAAVPVPSRAAVRDLRETIARAGRVGAEGDYEAALRMLDDVLETAQANDYPPVRAEFGIARGEALVAAGRYRDASNALRPAFHLAESVGHDVAMQRAATLLVLVDGYHLRAFQPGERWARRAESVIARGGGNKVDRAVLLRNLGLVRKLSGHPDDARTAYESALQIRVEAFGQRHPAVAEIHHNLGSLDHVLGNFTAAQRSYEVALRTYENTLGPSHPTAAMVIDDLGNAHLEFDRFSLAKEHFERARRIREGALEPGHPHRGLSSLNLGRLAARQGRFDEAARSLEEARINFAAAYGRADTEYAEVLLQLGRVAMARGDAEAGLAPLNEALLIFSSVQGHGSRGAMRCAQALLELHTSLGNTALAEGYAARVGSAEP